MMVEELEMQAPMSFGIYELILCVMASLAASLIVSSPFWLISGVSSTESSVQSFAALEKLSFVIYFLALLGFGAYKSKLDHNSDFRSFFEIMAIGALCICVPRAVGVYTL